jgi:hypothetical protein
MLLILLSLYIKFYGKLIVIGPGKGVVELIGAGQFWTS